MSWSAFNYARTLVTTTDNDCEIYLDKTILPVNWRINHYISDVLAVGLLVAAVLVCSLGTGWIVPVGYSTLLGPVGTSNSDYRNNYQRRTSTIQCQEISHWNL